MSVKHGLLTILAEHPRAGYDLRSEFEQRTGGTWPLNISQIYSTLQRLERDELVTSSNEAESEATLWAITEKGRLEAQSWWYSPTPRTTPSREEASIKVSLAITSPQVDTTEVIRNQRTESLRALRDYTKLKSQLGKLSELSREDLAWAMLLDSYIFTLESELRWLDHVEAKLHVAGINTGIGRPHNSAGKAPTTAPGTPTHQATAPTAGNQVVAGSSHSASATGQP